MSGVRERLTTPIVYSRHYGIDLGLHVFPTVKYRLIRDELERRQHELPAFEFVEPVPAGWDQLALVHSDEYLDRLRTGSLTGEEEAQLEKPPMHFRVARNRAADLVDSLVTGIAAATQPALALTPAGFPARPRSRR